jgi:prefoldin alpha subunit
MAAEKNTKVVHPFPLLSHLMIPGKPILVPLTSSLYVSGKLKNAGKVLVDVGTGYYIEKVDLGYYIILND